MASNTWAWAAGAALAAGSAAAAEPVTVYSPYTHRTAPALVQAAPGYATPSASPYTRRHAAQAPVVVYETTLPAAPVRTPAAQAPVVMYEMPAAPAKAATRQPAPVIVYQMPAPMPAPEPKSSFGGGMASACQTASVLQASAAQAEPEPVVTAGATVVPAGMTVMTEDGMVVPAGAFTACDDGSCGEACFAGRRRLLRPNLCGNDWFAGCRERLRAWLCYRNLECKACTPKECTPYQPPLWTYFNGKGYGCVAPCAADRVDLSAVDCGNGGCGNGCCTGGGCEACGSCGLGLRERLSGWWSSRPGLRGRLHRDCSPECAEYADIACHTVPDKGLHGHPVLTQPLPGFQSPTPAPIPNAVPAPAQPSAAPAGTRVGQAYILPRGGAAVPVATSGYATPNRVMMMPAEMPAAKMVPAQPVAGQTQYILVPVSSK